VREISVTANGLTFACLEEGEGPLALCLHGFPDSAHTWRHLLPELARAGFRAVAPFTRGYAPTEVPADGCYQAGALIADAVALHDVLGGDSAAVLVGHDWGAMTAYGAGAFEPNRWRRVVAMAVPPFIAAAQAVLGYDQIKRSFYVWLFQIPLAEAVVPMNDLEFIGRLWRDWSPTLADGPDLANAKDALRDPRNLAAAIGYYRGIQSSDTHQERYASAQAAIGLVAPQPTLYLHGGSDGAFAALPDEQVRPLLSAQSRYEIVPGRGHFLHLEEPAQINARILAWLGT
jgi:pimeloyl-ACP methyl ester carboxylesterase